MRYVSAFLGMLCFCFMAAQRAEATVNIQISLSTQTMSVSSDSGAQYEWPVSTARPGYVTPRGTFFPQRLMAMAYSIKYNMSPMPHSIFFTGGYAIHGTYETGHLGRPASHGCVRLAPANAATLYAMVQHEGARITITGSAPGGSELVATRHGGKHVLVAQRHRGGKTVMVAKLHRHATTALAFAPQPRAPTLHQWLENPLAQ